ncbi:NUDIX domain-containing protein [Candidatus Uhrbacteria bacterium]|nr:NUDIX domain-containing protein [Candidatus Uhrbacteria bacterium]
MQQTLQPKCGVGILVIKDGKLLLGKRKGSHGAGFYGSGGGHLEYGESFEEAAIREIHEEAGIEVQNLRFLAICNFISDGRHYIDVSFIADWKSGEAKPMEPEKLESWDWYDMSNLPSPLFDAVEKYIESYKTGKIFFDLELGNK